MSKDSTAIKVDAFDQYVIKQKGDPSEILRSLFGWEIGKNNAEKQLAGIRKYVRFKIDKETKKFGLPPVNEMDEVQFKNDGTKTTKRMIFLSEEDKKSPNRIMYLMGYDPIQWELINCKLKRKYWDVSMKLNQGVDSEGYKLPDVTTKKTNHAFHCEVTCKPIQDKITSKNILEIFENMKPPELVNYVYENNDGLMLELPIMDFHLGSLAWKGQTGNNWNYKKAIKMYKSALSEMIARIKQYGINIDRIIFPVGQDFYHFDNDENQTTKGTQMETDTRWQKILNEGFDLLVWAVEQLRAIAPIEIFWIPGNHDKKFSYFAVCYLHAWFRNTESVNVDLGSEKRKYVQYGKCLIGFSHGQDEGKRINDSMQLEVPKLWGKTMFREMHLGHIHHEVVREVGGVIIRNISAMTATDGWHKDKLFVGNIRKMQGILWDRNRGKQLTIDVNVNIN